MKSPEEIMKGLECCAKSFCSFACMKICPYFKEQSCGVMLFRDALALIQRLDETVVKTEMVATEDYNQKEELEIKLNQAVEDLKMLGRMGQNICPVCAHYNHGEGSKQCISCPKMDNFKWRGLVKEEGRQ